MRIRRGVGRGIVALCTLSVCGVLDGPGTTRAASGRAGPLVNEVSYWPDPVGGSLGWVELYNPGSQSLPLQGATLRRSDGATLATLPPWDLPPRAYLVVYLGAGADDPDFSDGAGAYYQVTGAAGLDPRRDAVALYAQGRTGSAAMEDFVAWSDTVVPPDGPVYDDAVAAGQWSASAFFATYDPNSIRLQRPVMPGDTVGRDESSRDRDAPADWHGLGGVDAIEPTPGRSNVSPLLKELAKAKPRNKEPAPAPAAKAQWTFMAIGEWRDSDLATQWIKEVTDMRSSASDDNVRIVAQFKKEGNTYRELLTQAKGMSNQEFILKNGPVNLADPQTIIQFINWAKTNYPAERYGFILASHGEGWKGINVWEEGTNAGHTSMAELSEALGALGQRFDVVFFESCLMGATEVGYQIAPQAKVMVASEEVAWSGLPWKDFFDELKKNPGWDGGEVGDKLARYYADALAPVHAEYTIPSLNLAEIGSTLLPALNPFADVLTTDVPDFKKHDEKKDNSQVVISEGAQLVAEHFADDNFKDLFDFADLVEKLPVRAAARAPAVKTALAPGGDVVRWEKHGSAHPRAHGLSIHFPHGLMGKNIDSVTPAEKGGIIQIHPVFDHPAPSRHLYKRDAVIKLPRVRGTKHAMDDDREFRFPDASGWDEFLQRFYKPVADACIRVPGDCLEEVTVNVGDTVTLSGNGSSDIDTGPRDGNGIVKWWWDMDVKTDNPLPLPDYRDNRKFLECKEDCDADEVDSIFDDPDQEGVTTRFTCTAPGDYEMRLTVWDNHNTFKKEFNEDESHNKGKHWLHFNVDSWPVTVHCKANPTTEPKKTASPSSVVPGQTVHYLIGFDGAGDPTIPAPATITDALPEAVELVEGSLICPPGDCAYDPEARIVSWSGVVAEGQPVTLEFDVIVVPPVPTCPPAIVNRARVHDGVSDHDVDATVTVSCPTD